MSSTMDTVNPNDFLQVLRQVRLNVLPELSIRQPL